MTLRHHGSKDAPSLAASAVPLKLEILTRGSGWGGTNVSCQLNFRLFVSCQLNFGPFVSCQLNVC